MDEHDAIAIVGVGCRFPGADGLEEFWRVLKNGEDHVKDIPKERFNVDAFFDSNPDAPGKTYIRKAGIVSGINEWDNRFFGVGENEAKQMDHQQQIVLECVYRAMEDGGFTKTDFNQSDTGVYLGAMNGEYEAVAGHDLKQMTNYSVTGLQRSIISARVAYFLNLHGPAITLDTACSSSLVAINTAEQAIKSGEVDMAICGGVNVLLSPTMPIALAKARMASKTGKCHTFSKNADGYTRGEGCGIVILKRLGDALRDNNKIWGIVASSCNQDGQENSPITAPAGVQQVKLLERIFKKTAVHPGSIQYIEAHGTGTPVGDPIEVNALGEFFGSYSNGHNVRIGSVKTNIGHLESAAGIAGLIKVLLMMKHGQYVPSLNAEELNENIPFEKYRFVVGRDNVEWKKDIQGCRLACINCFGFGGTNSHAIVYQKENLSLLSKTNKDCTKEVLFPNHRVVVVSAVTRQSLKEIAQDLRQNLNEKLEDISSTSVFRREHFKYRELIVTNSKSNLNDQLKSVAIKDDHTVSGTFSKSPSIVFVFCGVGTTWTGMCSEIMAKSPVFRKCVIEIDTYLEKLNANMSMYKTILNRNEIYDNPMKTHIAIFTIQVALAASWRHIGINPSAVVGQSVGEVAAAYECGSLSLEDAVTVIYHRSLALTACQSGAMMVIRNCATEEVNEACKEISKGSRNKVNIAVYNSSESSTVSGDKEALEELKTRLPSDAKFIPLNAPCAYHSHHTKQASERLFEKLQSLRPNTPRVQIFSTVAGKGIQNDFATAKDRTKACIPSTRFKCVS
ncbi:putative inactive phenolphthiocerol synthesis polyketide synthase type I Pks15 [Saccostrea cucullata]|uniref:putative inactive phenolphthiocerol synthesis polyketide synthase type I Pks15 n=1 Tax=Saccostrea cuccullata TaxID=36930 RepID=UPI002ED02450